MVRLSDFGLVKNIIFLSSCDNYVTINYNVRSTKIFRSIKISHIYSYTFKPKAEIPETPNCIYHFQCEGSEDYIGQSKRKLIVRVREYQQKSRKTAIWSHIQSCNAYKSKFKFFKKPNTDPNISEKQLAPEKQKLGLSNDKLKFKYFTSHFKILQKNFRNDLSND